MTPDVSQAQPSGVLKYEFLLLVMAIIWGTGFVAQQVGMEKGLGPLTFSGLRFALAAISLLPIIAWQKSRRPTQASTSPFPVKGSFLAGAFLFAAAGFQQVGLKYTSCANAGFISGFYVVFVPLFGLFLGHRSRASLWVGIVVAMTGFYFLSITDQFTIGKGDLLILICAFLWSGQILVIDKVVKNSDPIQIACVEFAVCAVLSTVVALVFESWSWAAIQAGAGALAYSGCISGGIAFTLQVICQKRCPPAPAAVIMSMEAVFAALAGYLYLNQQMSLRSALGCCLMLCGMLIVQLTPLIQQRRLRQALSTPG